MDADDPSQHESWQRVEPRLRALSGVRDGKGIVNWLAKQLQYKLPRVQNWVTRGIPADEHAAVAAAIGWSVAQVAGVKDPPEAWPFETLSKEQWAALTERQKAMVEMAAVAEVQRIEASRKAQVNGQ